MKIVLEIGRVIGVVHQAAAAIQERRQGETKRGRTENLEAGQRRRRQPLQQSHDGGRECNDRRTHFDRLVSGSSDGGTQGNQDVAVAGSRRLLLPILITSNQPRPHQ